MARDAVQDCWAGEAWAKVILPVWRFDVCWLVRSSAYSAIYRGEREEHQDVWYGESKAFQHAQGRALLLYRRSGLS